MNAKEAVKEYQCPGCVNGDFPNCYGSNTAQNSFDEKNKRCSNHVSGTTSLPGGKIFLGMPKGFNRKGPYDILQIDIFESFSGYGDYDKFNVPVWKYLDEHGHTLVRGISPRLNFPFLHVFLENCLDKVYCLEIKKEDIDNMD